MISKGKSLARVVVAGLLLLLPALADDQYLVRVSTSSPALTPIQQLVTGLTNLLGLSVLNSIVGVSGSNLYLISVSSGSDHDAALAALRTDPSVLDLEPNVALALPEVLGRGPASSSNTPAGPGLLPQTTYYYGTFPWKGYVNQAAAGTLSLAGAHRSFATGTGTVAFLDTGVDFLHPILLTSIVPGWDFTTNTSGGSEVACCEPNDSTTAILDDSTTSILDGGWGGVLSPSLYNPLGLPMPKAYGHGTMVAGLIHLAAPTAKLMPVRVFQSNGTTTLFRILQGIYYATDHGANVINMSFSSLTASTELSTAIAYASSHGLILVASVGNDGSKVMVYPAGFSPVIGVASTNNAGVRSSFSNYGNALVALAAPGEAVITTYPGSAYAAGWGTSFSAPLVAGGVAMLNQLDPADTASRAMRAFANGSQPGDQIGLGLIDLYQACLYRATHPNDQ